MLKAIQQFVGRVLGYEHKRDREYLQTLQSAFTKLRATYDAARTSDEFKNYWANADYFDADSANDKVTRHRLISRARYECSNNAYFDGIAQTIINDLVGKGPSLRMQTMSDGFNQLVELSWHLWSQAVGLNRKLWCMGHAKHVDGEAFAQLRRNPRVNHPIKLDLVLVEAEQCQSPYIPFNEANRIDGILFDEFGNPRSYEFLRYHPGSIHTPFEAMSAGSEILPAESVLHWFRLRRPGQHRGVPEMCSSLNVGAAARRWREANLTAAERAAVMTLMMKTQMTPEEADLVAPFSTLDIMNGMMSFLPAGWEMQQADGKFPTANYEMFHKQLINEMGRSVNMPRNKAAADSSDYNYASGRLDHGTYYDSLDVQRSDCDAQILSKLFLVWFDLAVTQFGWLGGDPSVIGPAAKLHLWDWPKHRVADVEADANANKTKLGSGQTTIPRVKAEAGIDAEDDAESEATYFGITVQELKQRQLDALYPPANQVAQPPTQETVEAWFTEWQRNHDRRGLNGARGINGNGANHAQAT